MKVEVDSYIPSCTTLNFPHCSQEQQLSWKQNHSFMDGICHLQANALPSVTAQRWAGTKMITPEGWDFPNILLQETYHAGWYWGSLLRFQKTSPLGTLLSRNASLTSQDCNKSQEKIRANNLNLIVVTQHTWSGLCTSENAAFRIGRFLS